ncbi:MAG: AzlC family ABC transporter permease [Ruminococcus sp.]|nr:AzlC family ABC transporter permease [Ruminococcus sp.]
MESKKLKALKCAFPKTVPIFAGFWFLGISYGIMMRTQGFSFLYPTLMAITIFGGSLEFVAASMLLGAFAPLQTLLVSFMIQARHLFYGIAMLEKYKGTGWKKPYLIYAMCDESFSINCSTEIPPGVDKGWFMFFVSLLNQIYWVSGAMIGGLLGSLVKFDTEGLSFVMTAMFVVIFLDSFLKEKQHISSFIGIGASVICLLIFGSESFMIPTMVCITVLLTLSRRQIEKREGDET